MGLERLKGSKQLRPRLKKFSWLRLLRAYLKAQVSCDILSVCSGREASRTKDLRVLVGCLSQRNLLLRLAAGASKISRPLHKQQICIYAIDLESGLSWGLGFWLYVGFSF